MEKSPNFNKIPKPILGLFPPQSIKAKRNHSEHIQGYVPLENPEMKALNAHQLLEIMNHSKTLARVQFFTKNQTLKANWLTVNAPTQLMISEGKGTN